MTWTFTIKYNYVKTLYVEEDGKMPKWKSKIFFNILRNNIIFSFPLFFSLLHVSCLFSITFVCVCNIRAYII